MTRQQRVLVFLLAIALLAGLGTIAVLMFQDQPAGQRGGQGAPAETERTRPQPSLPEVPRSRPAVPITPADAAPIKPKTFSEADHSAISGIVRDERDLPVEGALCELFDDASPLKDTVQEGELHASQRTDATGAFWFERISLPPSDHFLLKVRHPSFATARKAFDARALSAGGMVVVLKGGTRVAGRVTSATGEPLPAATVTMYDAVLGAVDPAGVVEASAMAEASGAWTIAHATPGSKRLVASAPGYASSAKAFVEVAAGTPVEHVDFALRAGGGISGRVTTGDGSPVEAIWITARAVRVKPPAAAREPDPPPDAMDPSRSGDDRRAEEPDAEKRVARARALIAANGAGGATPQSPAALPTLSARTGSDGRYAITGAEIGTYVLSNVSSGFLPSGSISVESPAQDANFVLTPGPRISGQVVDADTGQPVPKFRIGISGSPEQSQIGAWTKRSFGPPRFQEGRFELRELGTTGRVWLVADAPGYAGGRSDEIALTPNERREGLVIRMVRGATVKGRVVDTKGEPVADAVVSLEAGSGQPDAAGIFGRLLTNNLKPDVEHRTDSAGRFAIANVMPGSYVARARHDRFGPKTTAPFAVPPSGETAAPELVLWRGASIRGRVLLKDKAPDAEATVQIAPAAGGAGSMELMRSLNTDAEGRFEAGGLPAGQYRVSVVKRAGKLDFKDVFKPSGEVITLGEGEARELELD